MNKTDNCTTLVTVGTKVWNLSLSSRAWPCAWKQSNINPLAKGDTPTQYVRGFQGYNVTPVIARCFEKTVYNHFSKKTFEENLASNQYAYRDDCNCTDALIDLQNNYLKALDDKDCTCVRIFALNFSKAFDNVKYSLLGRKLKSLNMDSCIVNWYLSFLKDRCQRLVSRGTTYQCREVSKDMTQGSVSGYDRTLLICLLMIWILKIIN